MANKLAKLISLFLYPGLTGAAFTFILFMGVMGVNSRSFFSALIYAVLVTLAPYLVIGYLMRRGKVGDMDITAKEERRIFFRTSMPFYVTAFLFLFLARMPTPILVMGTGVMLFVLLYQLISPHYKISIHVGGLTFDLVAVGLVVNTAFFQLLLLVPLLAWARDRLKKHTWAQSLGGALIGGGLPLILYQLFL